MSSRRWAREEFEAFHWGTPSTKTIAATIDPPKAHEALAVLGRLRRIDYETVKDGQHAIWYHDFEHTFPYLATCKRGRLWIVGGSYRIRPEGIVG